MIRGFLDWQRRNLRLPAYMPDDLTHLMDASKDYTLDELSDTLAEMFVSYTGARFLLPGELLAELARRHKVEELKTKPAWGDASKEGKEEARKILENFKAPAHIDPMLIQCAACMDYGLLTLWYWNIVDLRPRLKDNGTLVACSLARQEFRKDPDHPCIIVPWLKLGTLRGFKCSILEPNSYVSITCRCTCPASENHSPEMEQVTRYLTSQEAMEAYERFNRSSLPEVPTEARSREPRPSN